MRTLDLALPGSIDRRTGGTIYDRRIVEGLRAAGWSVAVHELPGTHPFADDAAVSTADAVLAAARRPLLIDGLALPSFRLRARDPAPAGILALIHHPLAEETGLSAADATTLRAGEQADLARVRGIVVTSGFTARTLAADYGVQPERVMVVMPGTDPAEPQARAAATGGAVRLLSIAALVPRKGHRLLLQALQPLADLSWTLDCIGATGRDPRLAGEIVEFIKINGMSDRVRLLGEVPDAAVRDHLRSADVFVHAADYEGYGMALAEALKAGLPVVAVAGGAVSELVPPTAGILCPPGDVSALSAALRQTIGDPAHRRRLAEGAAAAGAGLPTWAASAGAFAAAIARFHP